LTPDTELPSVLIERGRTVLFDELPARCIALDGYVQGPAIDAEHERFSFDHHAGCIRHATLSTCEMALDAVRVGLAPGGFTLCVNDLDPDTVLAVWLLLRPNAAADDSVAAAIRAAGRLDALGPAVGGPGLVPALRWALDPVAGDAAAGLRSLADDEYRRVLVRCVERLDRWFAVGAPHAHPALPAPNPGSPPQIEVLHESPAWTLARSPAGLGGFRCLYEKGVRAAVVCRPLRDGSAEYTVGKASEFVSDFPVPRILAALARAESSANPAQSPAHNWGGGSTIGGSPRNPDGSASRLDWRVVAEVVEGVLRVQ